MRVRPGLNGAWDRSGRPEACCRGDRSPVPRADSVCSLASNFLTCSIDFPRTNPGFPVSQIASKGIGCTTCTPLDEPLLFGHFSIGTGVLCQGSMAMLVRGRRMRPYPFFPGHVYLARRSANLYLGLNKSRGDSQGFGGVNPKYRVRGKVRCCF